MLVGSNQTSFAQGRRITDDIIIAQEVMHSMRKKRGSKGFLALKVDVEKTYDKISWYFLQDTLRDISLPSLLIHVFMSSVSSSSMQVV